MPRRKRKIIVQTKKNSPKKVVTTKKFTKLCKNEVSYYTIVCFAEAIYFSEEEETNIVLF